MHLQVYSLKSKRVKFSLTTNNYEVWRLKHRQEHIRRLKNASLSAFSVRRSNKKKFQIKRTSQILVQHQIDGIDDDKAVFEVFCNKLCPSSQQACQSLFQSHLTRAEFWWLCSLFLFFWDRFWSYPASHKKKMGWVYAIINCCMPLLLLSLLQISFQSYCVMVFFPLNLWTVCLCLFLNLVKIPLEFPQFFVTSYLQFGFKIIHQPLFVLVFLNRLLQVYLQWFSCFACFLDASKVFDLVRHDILFELLKSCGLSSPVVHLHIFQCYKAYTIRVFLRSRRFISHSM